MTANPGQWRRHSPYSDPGRYSALLAELPDDVESLSAAARNVIAHYRAELPGLPLERRGEIDSRWLERILDLDQQRHAARLASPRDVASRVAGCCRDHSLFLTGALRTRGVPARNVVGFAGYFAPPFHHDHVVVEYWEGTHWVRTDPELTQPGYPFDVGNLPTGSGAPFETAAQVWRAYRSGAIDPDLYGVAPEHPLRGPDFIGGTSYSRSRTGTATNCCSGTTGCDTPQTARSTRSLTSWNARMPAMTRRRMSCGHATTPTCVQGDTSSGTRRTAIPT